MDEFKGVPHDGEEFLWVEVVKGERVVNSYGPFTSRPLVELLAVDTARKSEGCDVRITTRGTQDAD